MEHLATVFDRLQQFGIVLNPSKCVLGVPSLEFLGHLVDSHGIRPLPSKVAAIRVFPPPTSKRQLQRFLGMVNFYRRFLPNCADTILPLTSLLSGSKRTFELTSAALTSFEQVKALLADANLLTHFHADAPISLMVDASNVAVGAVLQQSLPDSTVPLAFFSKKLSKAETRYSTFGRELLAAYLAVRHFRHLLEGREFTIFTDHKPLTFAIHSHSDKLSPREIRHLDYISQFTSDIRHFDGSRSEVADALSRRSIAHLQLSPGIDLAEMAAEQRRVGPPCDEDVSGLKLQELPLTTGNGTILCDVSTPSHRPFVPPSLRRKVFSSLHNLSHPGSRATDKLVSDRFVWPGMHKDLKAWTRACLGCQRNKVRRHNKTPIGTFPTPDARFSHIHLDIVGPLPLSNGCSYLLTCVDRFTRWPEAIPLPDVAAPTVVKAFLSRWVAIFGASSIITTDRGAQFESHLFQSLLSFLGCTRIRTTAYHPAANGMVERFHRQLKASLRAADDPENWTDHLPLVLLGIRSSLKSDLDCSAAELVFGATVRLPGQMISPTPRVAVEDPTNLLHRLRQFLRTLSPVPPRQSVSESYLEKDLATCSHVYLRCDRVRRPLEPPYDGPFRVISRGTKNFRIQRGTREEVVSVDRLKAAFPDTPPDEPCGPLPPAPPPRPSIPPSQLAAAALAVRVTDLIRSSTDRGKRDLTELSVLSRKANFNTADAKPSEFIAALEAMLVRTSATDEAKHTVRQKVTSLLLTNRPINNLSPAEIEAMKELKMDKDIIMLPAGKGRATVVMNCVDYNEKAQAPLDDQQSYKSTPPSRAKSMISQLTGLLNRLKRNRDISLDEWRQMKPTDTTLARFYGLPKIHTPDVPLRPIVALNGSPTYNLSKWMARKLNFPREGSRTSINSASQFLADIRGKVVRPEQIMMSFDVVSLFTSIPPDLARDVLRKRLEENYDETNKPLKIDHLLQLFAFCQQTFFTFNGRTYEPIKGTPMGSPISSLVAELVLQELEKVPFDHYERAFWRRNRLADFQDLLNGIFADTHFTREEEHDEQLPFLDVLVTRTPNGELNTTVYRKATS
nr:unnamed protein product [Spirometra erinaceieuropaei]